MTLLALIFLNAVFVSSLPGSELYISNKNGHGTGTRTNPFGLADLPTPTDFYSEGPALSAMQPGDTLTFLPGIYDLHTSSNTVFGYIRPACSGTAEKPITVRAEGGVTLRTVSGTQGVLGTVKLRGWKNLNYIRFYGFTIECRLPFDKEGNPELNGIRLQGQKNEVGWCKFVGQYLPTRNNYDGIRVENAVEARIHHNEITGWLGDHWNANGIKVYCSDRCVVEDNYIHGNHTAIFEKDSGAGNIYRRNYVTGNKGLAFLGSNQTKAGRADAQYFVYENVFDGPVNLLTLSRRIEFHDNLLLGSTNDPDHTGYALYASGGKVYQIKVWNNVYLSGRGKVVAYGLDQSSWSRSRAYAPLEYCDYNVYDGIPNYRFGRYTRVEDVFTLDQMRSMDFEVNTKIVSGAKDVYGDQKNYTLKKEWLVAGRKGDPVGPDDVKRIMDLSRYGPTATETINAGSQSPGPNSYLRDLCTELNKVWPANRTVNIVCHGHSVPAGYFKTPMVDTFNAYPHLLHKKLKERFPYAVCNVTVTAIGGEASESGSRRFEKDVLSHKPDVVLIDYALNDRGLGLDKAKAAWVAMIQQAKAKGVRVILLTPTGDLSAKLDDPNDPLNKHAEQIRALAREHGVGLVDSLSAFKAYIGAGGKLNDLMSQVNHPNRKGHELVAKDLLEWFPE